jgi:hypothetical protein
MKLPFQPIARRDLKFVSPGHSMDITLALSAPYKKTKPDSLGAFACMIIDSDDPAFAREISGESEFEALEMVLIHFRNYIEILQESGAGELINSDGSPFSSSNVSLYSEYLKKSRDLNPVVFKKPSQ